ncbi:ATP-binding cassette domain-containing protein [Streptomyces sp. A1499]|uniref:ABC transporter permease subunit n=1 Tax=Streptomyces sp. A1499 TaxID=2563104 RepID=UPI00109EBED0|nr:ATP-binding cassette domain-containing protein [Streptomyces sp. A1499]THC45538.1 ATP-binding cassette domain-containing protein [Streptomyces sp. A1499]
MSSLSHDLTLAGLSVGGAAALTGIGLIVTYRATGVLNFAHGATAMVCAYVLRQLTVDWHWPLAPAAAVTLLLVAPGIGLLLDRAVFRPLAVLGGDPAQTLVASIGVFVLLVGGAALIWGPGARDDAPTLLSADPWAPLGAAVALAAAVGAVTRWTRFGGELRAVVDDRALAALFGVNAGRVAAAGWAFGSFTAGLTGVLLAPSVRLDPYGMPLLVMEVMAVAVAARMRGLTTAVAVALALGVAQSQLTRLHPSGPREQLIQTAGANLFVLALLAAALILPGIGSKDALPRTASARVPTPPGAWPVAALLFLIPLGFAGQDLTTSVRVPALAVILLSLVIVTGRGGQISLGQAAYAGLGALFTALLTAGRFPGLPELPHLPALAVAVLLVAPLGLLTGRPAISRHGLALALATFAFGVGVSRFVFAQPYATAGLTLDRPAGFVSDRAYYTLELALLTGALLLVTALRRGRTGRALAALRDHEAGAAAAGAAVGALKLTAFVTGAALAALGGGMLAMGQQAFDPAAFDPVRGLLWFAAVMVLGSDSLLGALTAAALLVGLDAGTRGGMAAAVIGVLAILMGRFPGGPYEALRKATHHLHPASPHLTPRGKKAREALQRATGPTPHPRTADRRKTPPTHPAPTHPGTPPADRTETTSPHPGRPPLRPEGTWGCPRAQHRAPRDGTGEAGRPHRDGEHADTPAAPTPRRGEGARTEADGALTAHRITLTYGNHTALDDVSLTVPRGRITALTGENGAGKSTLFHCLAGTLRPDRGRITLHGRDITRLPAHARTRAGMARTFQQPAVFSSLTITENVQVAADHSPRSTHRTTSQALRLLNLTSHHASPATDLPTGTLRRTELARALAGAPHTLLLDEPAAGLDATEVEALATLLRTLAADGMALLVVEHDLAWLAGLADTVHVMRAGRIVASGPAEKLLNAPEADQ